MALVVAVSDNGIIGRDGALPWHLPDDLKHFKAVTLGKPVLMGRRTFESIGRALPGRRNLVLSRSGGAHTQVEFVATLAAALALVAPAQELCVIGGAQVYALCLPQASRVYLTQVHAQIEGDTRFALDDGGAWRETQRIEHAVDERHAYAMSFLTLERP